MDFEGSLAIGLSYFLVCGLQFQFQELVGIGEFIFGHGMKQVYVSGKTRTLLENNHHRDENELQFLAKFHSIWAILCYLLVCSKPS
jgi:hypothetical protein